MRENVYIYLNFWHSIGSKHNTFNAVFKPTCVHISPSFNILSAAVTVRKTFEQHIPLDSIGTRALLQLHLQHYHLLLPSPVVRLRPMQRHPSLNSACQQMVSTPEIVRPFAICVRSQERDFDGFVTATLTVPHRRIAGRFLDG